MQGRRQGQPNGCTKEEFSSYSKRGNWGNFGLSACSIDKNNPRQTGAPAGHRPTKSGALAVGHSSRPRAGSRRTDHSPAGVP
jgi:hypothetical protein